MDVNLPGKSGIKFARNKDSETAIIFVSAYAEYAVEGFELEAADYILKPISYERLWKAINKYSKMRELNEIVHLTKKQKQRTHLFL